MYAEKFELLEAKIRETAMLVSRLREEKQQLEWENEHLRARVAELEEQLQGVANAGQRYEPEIDHLLEQLETLQQGEESPPRSLPASNATASRSLPAPSATPPESPPRDPAQIADHMQRGLLYEQQGEYEPAIHAYQRALEVDGENLDAAQRLAFLLEKLNRDAEAAALWDKIWAMRGPQTPARRRRLR